MKTAVELGITEQQHDALVKTLELFEGGQVRHVPVRNVKIAATGEPKLDGLFNMGHWGAGTRPLVCGTVACIGGTAELIAGERIFNDIPRNASYYNLFFPWEICEKWEDVTVEHAARALRSYLDTGTANWGET